MTMMHMLSVSKTMILFSTILTFGSYMCILDAFIVVGIFMGGLEIILRLTLELLVILIICEFNIVLMTDDNKFMTHYDAYIVIILSPIARLLFNCFPYAFYCIHHVNSIMIFTTLFISLMLIISIENICMKKFYGKLFIYLKLI